MSVAIAMARSAHLGGGVSVGKVRANSSNERPPGCQGRSSYEPEIGKPAEPGVPGREALQRHPIDLQQLRYPHLSRIELRGPLRRGHLRKLRQLALGDVHLIEPARKRAGVKKRFDPACKLLRIVKQVAVGPLPAARIE